MGRAIQGRDPEPHPLLTKISIAPLCPCISVRAGEGGPPIYRFSHITAALVGRAAIGVSIGYPGKPPAAGGCWMSWGVWGSGCLWQGVLGGGG